MATICVFCGSSSGARESYAEAARRLGHCIARGGHRLVYGGASVGLMGLLADAVLAGGAEVLGVLPRELSERERTHGAVTTLERVASMAERKTRMIELADAFVALPGGIGTYDEIFEVLTGVLIGSHEKPLGLLDLADYWRPLLALLEQGEREGFIPASALRVLHRDADPEQLFAMLGIGAGR